MVCDRWKNIHNFIADMGEKPFAHYTLEREDNDGNYEPTNCIWASGIIQDNNKRTNHLLTFQNRTQTVAMWARELNIRYSTLLSRILCYKWSVEKALTTPVKPT